MSRTSTTTTFCRELNPKDASRRAKYAPKTQLVIVRWARPINVLAIDPRLEGAAAVLDERGDLIACFDLPVIGEGKQRRIDAANFDDLIRGHGPHTFAIVEQASARPKQVRTGLWDHPRRQRGAGDPHPPRFAREVKKGARPQQRQRNVARPGDRDMARPGRAFRPEAGSQPCGGRLAGAVWPDLRSSGH
jgi:hypothetical protein